MFFVLGLLVFPSQLGGVFVTGTGLALVDRAGRPPGGGLGGDHRGPA